MRKLWMLRFEPSYIKNRQITGVFWSCCLLKCYHLPGVEGYWHTKVYSTSSVWAELKEADIFRRPPGVKYPWQQVLLKSLILSVINNKYRGWLWGLNTPYTHKISRQILAPTAWREITFGCNSVWISKTVNVKLAWNTPLLCFISCICNCIKI